MVIAIVLVLLALGIAGGFVQALRMSGRARARAERSVTDEPLPQADAAHLDRLTLGAQVTYDRQDWVVIGSQRVTPRGGTAWTAWHLDDRGQPGWLATTDGDREHVVFAVGAEHPETVDPRAVPLRWRDVVWEPIGATDDPAQPTVAEGRRRRLRTAPEALPATDVQRVTFTRAELPRRRLVLERQAGTGPWAVWIGDLVPASMLDVYPPVRLPGPADDEPGPGEAPTPDDGPAGAEGPQGLSP